MDYSFCFVQKEGCTIQECWQFPICMMIWKILHFAPLEGKCVYMVTRLTPSESTSKPRSELGF